MECVHCSGPIGVTGWDDWNGFLVTCPHCGGCHGRSWSIERTLLSALFLNALSFFFTFRPGRAAIYLVVYSTVLACSVALALRFEEEAFAVGALVTFALGPLLINGIALVRHRNDLHRPPPVDPTAGTVGERGRAV